MLIWFIKEIDAATDQYADEPAAKRELRAELGSVLISAPDVV